MAVQRGRSERRPEAYPLGYVEDLSNARTMLAGFFNSLLVLDFRRLMMKRRHLGTDQHGKVFVP